MADPANPLGGRSVVVGVAGGIAAYKAVELVRLLTKRDCQVRVVMTRSAQEFVGALTFQTLSGHPVFTDMFDLTQESEIGHIQVADGADLVIVAPATADLIARASAGRTSDALSAVLLATRAPVLLAPSMNVNMWEHPLTQQNLRRLIDARGVYVVGPGDGFLACRWTGPGRLAAPVDIVEAAARILTPQDLAGRRFVVSAGPTREAFDPVRFLSNRSTGKMGFAIANAASRHGADVTLIAGPTHLSPSPGVSLERVTTAVQMREAVRRASTGADAVIMAAAVSDFRPSNPSTDKLEKAGDAMTQLAMERNPDILAELGAERSGARPLLVGFAAETQNVVDRAKAKLSAKRCDLIVANDVSASDAGFEVDTNRVALVSAGETEQLELMTKDQVAHHLCAKLAAVLSS